MANQELTKEVLEKAISNFKAENPDYTWEEVSQEIRWSYLDKAYPANTEAKTEAPVAEPIVEAPVEPPVDPTVTKPVVKPTADETTIQNPVTEN